MNHNEYWPYMDRLQRLLTERYHEQLAMSPTWRLQGIRDDRREFYVTQNWKLQGTFLLGPLAGLQMTISFIGKHFGFQAEVRINFNNTHMVSQTGIMRHTGIMRGNYRQRLNAGRYAPEGWPEDLDLWVEKLYHTIVDCLGGCAYAHQNDLAGTEPVCEICPIQLECLARRSA